MNNVNFSLSYVIRLTKKLRLFASQFRINYPALMKSTIPLSDASGLFSHLNSPDSKESWQMSLFPYEMEDIYHAEKAFIKAIPEMISNCNSEEMAITLTGYFNLAVKHVTHFEKLIISKNSRKKLLGIATPQGFFDEAHQVMIKTEGLFGMFI